MNCIVIGDMGKGTDDQHIVARTMKKLYKKQKIQFVLGVGDNIYPDGCKSVNDKLFYDNFEKPYDEPRVNLESMKGCQLDYFSPSLGVCILRIQKNSLQIDFYNDNI